MTTKMKKWRVKSHRPKTMPPEIMEFIDPFYAKNEEFACFKALVFTSFSLYRDKEKAKGRTSKDILTELGYSVVRV